MTLANPEVLTTLARDYVVGWKNIEREPWRGESRGYTRNQTALGTSNGAGARNVQIFVLSPDLVVLHALPGFWHPDDLLAELRFAQLADRLWRDDARTRAQKAAMLARLHRAHVDRLPEATLARSGWQSFDRFAELAQFRQGPRDTFEYGDAEVPDVKPTIVLAHERLLRQPFAEFASFDVAAFTRYGLEHYDNNAGVDHQGLVFRAKPPAKKVAKG